MLMRSTIIFLWLRDNMTNVRLLDCTLRDGGYCNNWTFEQNNIHKIVNGLLEASLDIIEVGYIRKNLILTERNIFLLNRFLSLSQKTEKAESLLE